MRKETTVLQFYRRRIRARRPRFSALIIFALLICCVACGPSVSAVHTTKNTPAQVKAALPGEHIWKDNTSSFLFGTNDTYEWSQHNMETDASIQQALRNAGVSLIRSFFPDKATDSAIDQRVQAIEQSGAQCLGVITDVTDSAFNAHLVSYLGKRCLLYEFGNEPDWNHVPLTTYLNAWNSQIPVLRKENPAAMFIGPATYTYQGNDQGVNDYLTGFLRGTVSSHVLPDAVSFHWYPCYQDSSQSCLAKATSYTQAAQAIRSVIKTILGKELPIGISEWNFDPSNPPPSYGDDSNFITQFSTTALNSMAQAGVAFACQFDAASYSGYGHLDMFDVTNNDQPKPQYYAIKAVIAQYRPGGNAPPAQTAAQGDSDTLVSRGKPVVCTNDTDGAGGPGSIVNGHYGDWSFWRSSLKSLPASCAIQVGTGPKNLLMVWSSDYIFDYISDQGQEPSAYTISTSADSTNGADGTWHTVVSVTGNQARVREHLIPFDGQSWVKMTVTAGASQAQQPFVTIDQIDLFDVSANKNDTFIFSGDSITAMAYSRFDADQPSYAALVHQAYPQHFPAMLDGGLGGWNTDGAVQNIDTWLTLNPDVHYWLLGWGTNDALEDVAPAHFQANLQTLVDKIKGAGRVPIFAHIPYSLKGAATDQEIQALNAVIDHVTASNGLITGPDMYQLFHDHARTYLLSDDLHPTAAGAIAMNQAWFAVLRSELYRS